MLTNVTTLYSHVSLLVGKSCVFPLTDATLAKLVQTLKDEMLGFLNNLGFSNTSAEDLLNDLVNSQLTTNKGDKLKAMLDAEKATARDVATVGDEFKSFLDHVLDTMGEENAKAEVESLVEDLEKLKEELEGKDGGDGDDDDDKPPE